MDVGDSEDRRYWELHNVRRLLPIEAGANFGPERRVEVSVAFLQHLLAHAEIPRGLADLAAQEHQLRRRRVPQDVRGDAGFERGFPDRAAERLADLLHRLAVVLDEVVVGPEPVPSPHVGEEPFRKPSLPRTPKRRDLE